MCLIVTDHLGWRLTILIRLGAASYQLLRNASLKITRCTNERIKEFVICHFSLVIGKTRGGCCHFCLAVFTVALRIRLSC